MITVRPSNERGHANHGWLDSRFSFSFAEYYHPDHMGFRSLRVINDDWIGAGGGFGMHPHRDMEIVTYVLEGAIEHKDSMGTQAVVRPGEVQRMTAGTGVLHSEFNPSQTEKTRLLQIWILPEQRNLKPGYEQTVFPAEEKQGKLRLVASRDGREGSVLIHQDTALYVTLLSEGQEVSHPLAADRHAWVQVARGTVQLNGQTLAEGDGAAVSEEALLTLRGAGSEGEAEVLLFDLA